MSPISPLHHAAIHSNPILASLKLPILAGHRRALNGPMARPSRARVRLESGPSSARVIAASLQTKKKRSTCAPHVLHTSACRCIRHVRVRMCSCVCLHACMLACLPECVRRWDGWRLGGVATVESAGPELPAGETKMTLWSATIMLASSTNRPTFGTSAA